MSATAYKLLAYLASKRFYGNRRILRKEITTPPEQIQAQLLISRASLYRSLARLRQLGLVEGKAGHLYLRDDRLFAQKVGETGVSKMSQRVSNLRLPQKSENASFAHGNGKSARDALQGIEALKERKKKARRLEGAAPSSFIETGGLGSSAAATSAGGPALPSPPALASMPTPGPGRMGAASWPWPLASPADFVLRDFLWYGKDSHQELACTIAGWIWHEDRLTIFFDGEENRGLWERALPELKAKLKEVALFKEPIIVWLKETQQLLTDARSLQSATSCWGAPAFIYDLLPDLYSLSHRQDRQHGLGSR